MEQLYYLNRERFEKGDTTEALNKVIERIKANHDVDTVTFLVCQQNQYESFLGELGFNKRQTQAHGFYDGNLKIQIHTVKTYSPSNALVSDTKYELLIAVCVPPKELEKFIDASRVKYWVIVPYNMEENERFLQVFQAINLETNKQISINYQVDERIKMFIGWLKDTSNPNTGYIHPYDNNRLKSVANVIKQFRIPFEHDAIINYCINNGLTFIAAKITVECFEKAQKRKFPTDGAYDTYLREMVK